MGPNIEDNIYHSLDCQNMGACARGAVVKLAGPTYFDWPSMRDAGLTCSSSTHIFLRGAGGHLETTCLRSSDKCWDQPQNSVVSSTADGPCAGSSIVNVSVWNMRNTTWPEQKTKFGPLVCHNLQHETVQSRILVRRSCLNTGSDIFGAWEWGFTDVYGVRTEVAKSWQYAMIYGFWFRALAIFEVQGFRT